MKSDEELIEECEEHEWEIEFYHIAVGCLVSWKQVLLVYFEGLASARKKLRKSKQKSKKQLKGHHYSLV